MKVYCQMLPWIQFQQWCFCTFLPIGSNSLVLFLFCFMTFFLSSFWRMMTSTFHNSSEHTKTDTLYSTSGTLFQIPFTFWHISPPQKHFPICSLLGAFYLADDLFTVSYAVQNEHICRQIQVLFQDNVFSTVSIQGSPRLWVCASLFLPTNITENTLCLFLRS